VLDISLFVIVSDVDNREYTGPVAWSGRGSSRFLVTWWAQSQITVPMSHSIYTGRYVYVRVCKVRAGLSQPLLC